MKCIIHSCNQSVHFHIRATNIASNVSFLLSTLGISAIFTCIHILSHIHTRSCKKLASEVHQVREAQTTEHWAQLPIDQVPPHSLGNGSFPSRDWTWTWWYTRQECSLAADDVGGRAASWIRYVATWLSWISGVCACLGTASCWWHHTRQRGILLQLKPLRLALKTSRSTLPHVSEVLDYVWLSWMPSSCLVGVALKWYHILSLHAKATHTVLDVVYVVGILSTARLEQVEIIVWGWKLCQQNQQIYICSDKYDVNGRWQLGGGAHD